MGGRGSSSGGAKTLLSGLGSDEHLSSKKGWIRIEKRENGKYHVFGVGTGRQQIMFGTTMDKKQVTEIINKNIKEGNLFTKEKNKPIVQKEPVKNNAPRKKYIKYRSKSVDIQYGSKNMSVRAENFKTWSAGGHRRIYFDIGNDDYNIGSGYIDSSKNAKTPRWDRVLNVGRRRIVLQDTIRYPSSVKREAVEYAIEQIFKR